VRPRRCEPIAGRRQFIAHFAAYAAALGFPDIATAARCKTVYIGGHTRHASIIVDRRNFDPAKSLDTFSFNGKYWLEFGWGDADFYQAKGEDVLLGLKALFLPTGAVMHVHGFNGSPSSNFPETEIIELQFTPEGYERLLAFIRESFARDPAGKTIPLGKGLYGLSRFYRGTGTYSMFNTCNTWTAKALAAGGFPIDPDDVGTVGQFMEQVRGKHAPRCPAAIGEKR
jgi:uncharacterized protein (TIGR02117 family)